LGNSLAVLAHAFNVHSDGAGDEVTRFVERLAGRDAARQIRNVGGFVTQALR
jgi:hypothetical protein